MAKTDVDEKELLATAVTDVDPDAPDGFFPRLGRALAEHGTTLPEVTIRYRNLSVVVAATSSAKSLPSLPNVLLNGVKALLCQRASTEPLNVLNNLSGSIQPGRLTLLLGPPSCGKTTFLKALAGRLPRARFEGDVTYNGHALSEFCAERTAVFVAQTDAHIANLTARETAQFSYDTQHGPKGTAFQAGAALDAPADGGKAASGATAATVTTESLDPASDLRHMSDSEFIELTRRMLDGPGRVDLIMEFFGLTRAKGTWVGSAMQRGISGGERKRLSTVELLMGGQRVLVLDEISTGLDAATLFNVTRWLRAMCRHLRTTVLVSLLQPPPETFANFDDVMIMNHGTIVYHGAASDAVGHMRGLGFELPPRKDVPSFLQEVTTPRGQVTYATPALRAAHRVPADLDTSDDVAMAQQELLVPLATMAAASPATRSGDKGDSGSGPGGGALVPRGARYTHSSPAQLRLVLARQATLFKRDPTLSRARVAQCVIVGLIMGGLWFDLAVTATTARTFMSAFFLMTMFMAFGGMPQLAVVLQNRVVWFKQRDMNMYNASAYAWSAALVQLPLSVLESFIFTAIVYFMIGFSTDGARYFFIAYLVLATASLALTSIFRLVGCLFQNAAAANGAAGFLLLMLIVNSGFIIVRTALPPWIVYFYWVSPFAYSIRALVVNEFTAPRWQGAPSAQPGVTLGDASLRLLDFYTERKWIWIGVAFNVAVYLLLTQLAAVALRLLHPPRAAVVIKRKEQIEADIMAARKAKEDARAALRAQGAADRADAAPDIDYGRADDSSGRIASRRRSAAALDTSVASALKFTPISLVWQDLCYYVAVPKGLTGAAALNIMPEDADKAIAGKKRLLNGLTGYAVPGVLTALMGGSGAGKTTLMDVLAGRKTEGTISGGVLVNGHPKHQATWARVVGYVEQTDVHSAGLTVQESLEYSAGLRLTADVSRAMREAYVLEVLLVTELLDIRGNLVGAPAESGLSVEQRRRLSIGVELVSNPSVVFLDEPTSGLDARSAAAVMAAVRNVASNGRTVMVTIHQPSIEIFESFDRLVLLGMGGESIYVGPLGHESRRLVDYFEAIPGVSALPDGYNPATWMLEVSGGGAKMHTAAVKADFAALYRASPTCRDTNARAAEVASIAQARTEPLSLASRYAASRARQTVMVTWKLFLVYWRSPNYTVGRYVVTLITAVIFGLTWWQEGTLPRGRPAELSNIQNIVGSLYAGLSFMGMTNLISGIPSFLAERNVMYRERAASMYAALPYAVATGVVEVPYLVAQAAIFVPIAYFMIGFEAAAEPVFLFIIVFMQSISLYTFMGQLFSYLAPSAPIATMLGGLCHLLWNIFNGFLVPIPQMAAGWAWLNYISATTYVIYGLAASQLGDKDQPIVVPRAGGGALPCTLEDARGCPSVKEYLQDYFGYEYEFRWWCVLILMAFIVVFRVGAMVALKLVSHEHR